MRCPRVLILLVFAGLSVWPSQAAAQMVVHTVAITTDGSGDATAYTPTGAGFVQAIRYVPDGSTPLDAGADLTITDNVTGLGILTITNIGTVARDLHVRVYTVDTTGVSALYAAAGQPVLDRLPIAGAIKVVVAQGGATKSGTLYVYVGGR